MELYLKTSIALSVTRYGYQNETKQRVKENNAYRSDSDIQYGTLQGSILGLLLLNSNICAIFRRL